MRAIPLVLFFLSGVSALIYQVVWLRMLTLVFGVTSFAVATVLSVFMAGLALGSYYGGRFIDGRQRPLAIFSGLQFAMLYVTAIHYTPEMSDSPVNRKTEAGFVILHE